MDGIQSFQIIKTLEQLERKKHLPEREKIQGAQQIYNVYCDRAIRLPGNYFLRQQNKVKSKNIAAV